MDTGPHVTVAEHSALTLYLILCSACSSSHLSLAFTRRSNARNASPMMGLPVTGWLLSLLPPFLLLPLLLDGACLFQSYP